MTKLRFIVPGLIDPVPYLDALPSKELPDLPLFSLLLSRGLTSQVNQKNSSEYSYYHFLQTEILSLNKPQTSSSIAAYSYLSDLAQLSVEKKSIEWQWYHDNDIANKYLMRVDPCVLAPDRDQLVLAKIKDFALSIEQAQQIIDDIHSFYNNDVEKPFWQIKLLVNQDSIQHWYLISDKEIKLQTTPPENVLGSSIKSHLPYNKDRQDKYWFSLFNEFQMILYQSSIKQQDQNHQKPKINALWFWGVSEKINTLNLDVDVNSDNSVIYSENFFAKTLSQVHNKVYYDWISSCTNELLVGKNKSVLVIVDCFQQALRNKDLFTWVHLVELFEKEVLFALFKGLKQGELTELEFLSPSGKSIVINKKRMNQWWRKKQSIWQILARTNED